MNSLKIFSNILGSMLFTIINKKLRVRIKSIYTQICKTAFGPVLYLLLSDSNQSIIISFEPKILITLHLQVDKKSVVNWDWVTDIFLANQKTPHWPFVSCAKLCYNLKKIFLSMKIFKEKLTQNEGKYFFVKWEYFILEVR